jgi:hypothetical protein
MSRSDNVEPALFAFVKHVPFIWNDGALFIGSKRINDTIRSVWYNPLTPGDSVGESLYLNQRDSFNGDSIHKCTPKFDEALVDRFWPYFTTLFDLSIEKGDYKYITGVHTILFTFPKLRKSCSDRELRAWAEGRSNRATDHVPLKKYELPFLPESVWMSKPIGWRPPPGPRPSTPYGDSSSRQSRHSSSTTLHHSSIKDIERVQSLIQDQRGRLVTDHEQQADSYPELDRHNSSEWIEKSYEPTEATPEAITEVSNIAASQVERKTTPTGRPDLSTANSGNRVFQQDDVELSFRTADRILLDRSTVEEVRLTVIIPTHILLPQPVLQFSPLASVDIPPIVPPRRLILEALCALAMTTVENDTQ